MSKTMKSKQRGFFQRIAQTWLQISGPDVTRFEETIDDQERLRRSRLLSVLFSLIIVIIVLVAPTAIPVPTYWIPLGCFVVLSVGALALNRMALITLSGIVYILAIDATLAILMITLPNGIRNSNIPDFDLFILPTLIGSIVLPRRIIPFLAIAHIITILILFSSLHHDPLLTQEILVNQKGAAYSELSDAFIIQIVGATIAWLAAWSVDRALLRASRAEDLAEARRLLNEQSSQIVQQKERLDYGISILKDAQARFANGDYKARAKLQNNELSSLAVSFNLMVDRLNRIAQIAQEYRRLESALQQLFEIQSAMADRRPFTALTSTGTMVDHIYPTFQRYYQLNQVVTHYNASFDKIRKDLNQQKSLLLQLESMLGQMSTLLQLLSDNPKSARPSFIQFVEEAERLCSQINEQGKILLQELPNTRSFDRIARSGQDIEKNTRPFEPPKR